MAAYPGPPPVIPLPESLAAQRPYVRLSCPGLARARNVSRPWVPPGPATEPHVVKGGGAVAPRRVQGGLPGSPRSGLEQTKDRDPTPVVPRWDSRS